MVVVSQSYGTLPGGASSRLKHRTMIVGSVATLAVAAVAMTAVTLFATSSVTLLSKTHTLAPTYQTAQAAREELNSFFDHIPVRKHALKKDFTAAAAKQQLNAIFGNSKADHMDKKIHTIEQKTVMQDLAYSTRDANSDLDDYFNNLQQSNDATIDDDGLPTMTREKSKAQEEQKAVDKEEIENYKKHNPEFKKQMDEVHLKWMEAHGHLPKTKAEVKAYAELVNKYVGDIGDLIQKARKSTASTLKEDPNLRKQALQKFLHENPDVKRKMAAAKKAFFDKYGHAPQSAKQNQEYHDLMKKYVGHVDISVEKILGKGAIKQARTQKKRMVPDAFSRAQDKLNEKRKQRAQKNAGHADEVPSNIQEAAERRAHETAHLAAKMNKHPDAELNKLDEEAMRTMAKQSPKKAEPKKADAKKAGPKQADAKKAESMKGVIEMMEIPVMPDDTEGATRAQLHKMRELKDFEKKDKNFAKKLNKVHMEWAKSHHGPPHTAEEQKEYAKLLKKVVGDESPLAHSKKAKMNEFHAPDLNDQFKVAGGKGVSSLATEKPKVEHSAAEITMAKVKALQDLESHDPKIKSKIAEVHHQWMKAGHKAPPSTPAEEKEYQGLMQKIVGHPDISFQTN